MLGLSLSLFAVGSFFFFFLLERFPNSDSPLTERRDDQAPLLSPRSDPPDLGGSAAGTLDHSWKVKLNWF